MTRTSETKAAEEAGSSGQFPDYRRNVVLAQVKQGYTILSQYALTLVLVPLSAAVTIQLWQSMHSGHLERLYLDAAQRELQVDMVTVTTCACLLSVLLAALFWLRTSPVYLINFSVYKPPACAKVSHDYFKFLSHDCKKFDAAALEFQERIITRSGLGDETYLPLAVRSRPPVISMENARKEAEMVLFGAVRDALAKTGLKPSQIGILVVNCSLFNPTPSLAAMIINHFKMRTDIVSYNLAGMGCSAGVIAVDLAAKLLQLHSNSYALVVSTENITQNWYFGNQRSMLLPNCLFRVGCSAVVLSNRRLDYWRAKYQLACPIVRTITGGRNDAAYHCIYQMEDDQGNKGVKLTRELMGEAGRALKANITTLGPLVLPFSEQLLFLLNLIGRKVLRMKLRPYIPDFKLAFEHFCIHTGGRAVIEEIEKQLQLPEHLVAPSKDTLYRYGNTSSSSIWYILARIETTQGVRPGDRVWQIGFGSGFKCNSAVWRSLRHNREQHAAWVEGVEMETDPKWLDDATFENLAAAAAASRATSGAVSSGAQRSGQTATSG